MESLLPIDGAIFPQRFNSSLVEATNPSTPRRLALRASVSVFTHRSNHYPTSVIGSLYVLHCSYWPAGVFALRQSPYRIRNTPDTQLLFATGI